MGEIGNPLQDIDEARGYHEFRRWLSVLAFAGAGFVLVWPFLADMAGCATLFVAMLGATGLSLIGRAVARSPMRMFCGHCGKYAPSDVPWTCGYCGEGNEGNWHSFLHKCANCGRRPPGFKCPHPGCGHGIFEMNDDADRAHWAYRGGDTAPDPLPPAPEPSQATFERQMRELDNDIKLAKLRRELELAKRAYEKVREPDEPKPREEADPVEEVLRRVRQATRKEEAVSGYVLECKERWTKEGRPREDIDRLTMRLKAVTTQVLATIEGPR